MKARKCWEVPACPQEKREAMIKEMEEYLDVNLQKCYVKTEADGDNYIMACRMRAARKKGDGKTVLTARMSFYGTACKVYFEYDISRAILYLILAAITFVMVLPAITFCAMALLRLYAFLRMTKDLRGITEKYAGLEPEKNTCKKEIMHLLHKRKSGLDKNEQFLKRKKRELRKQKRSFLKAYAFLILVIICVILASGIGGLYIRNFMYEKQKSAYASLDRDYWEKFYGTIGKETSGAKAASTVLKEKNCEELNRYISSLKRRPVQTVALIEQDGEAYYRYVQKNDIGEYTIAEAGNDIIFPGAIVKGDSLFHGTADYTLISASRSPMYLTNTQIEDSSVLVNHVNYRSVSSVLHDYAAKGTKKEPQNWKYYLKSINSEDDVKLSFGVSVADIGLDLGFTQSYQKSVVAVVYKQVYYSVNAEPLQNASDYFEDGTDLADLGEYEPAYISSVDYGRMFVVFVSGNMDSSELGAKLGVCLNGVSIGAGLSNIITDEELEVAIFQYGGKAGDPNKLFEGKQGKLGIIGYVKEFIYGSEGEEDIVQRVNGFLELDGDLENPKPLSYRLKYLSDNEILPAVAIEREGVIPAKSAKTVTLDMSGDLQLNFPDNAGMILPQTEGFRTTLLWNSCFSEPVTGTLGYSPITLDLYSCRIAAMQSVRNSRETWEGAIIDFFGMNEIDAINDLLETGEANKDMHISDSVAEMP